jgi:hypothetical protein
VTWAQEVLDALGGRAAWDGVQTVRFAFTVSRHDTVLTQRTHYWDKAHGRDRIDGTTRAGKAFVCLANLDGRLADTYLDGAKLTGQDSVTWADRAYGMWVNDSYWLFMPYKMLDAGVHLADVGDTTEVGVRYHRVRLTFDHVGLTPGDTYWVYINPTSHMVEKWAYILQGESPPPMVWWWEDWRKVGPLMLAATRRSPNEPTRIELRDLAYFAQLPASAFMSPAPVVTK